MVHLELQDSQAIHPVKINSVFLEERTTLGSKIILKWTTQKNQPPGNSLGRIPLISRWVSQAPLITNITPENPILENIKHI